MTIEDEKFFAWLDGELPPDGAAEIAAEVARSPELARAAEQHRAMQTRLRAAFDTVAQAPVPDRLRPRANVIDFGAAKRARAERRWGSPAQWAAMAAALAIGIFAGSMVASGGGGPVQVQGGRIYAAAGLKQALDTELASAPSNAAVRIGLTFRDQSGEVCRTFTDAQSSGLACRDGPRWQLRGLFAAPEGQGGAYRMAASMDPDLAALVDSTMAGDPLDARQEKAAKAKGWK